MRESWVTEGCHARRVLERVLEAEDEVVDAGVEVHVPGEGAVAASLLGGCQPQERNVGR